MRAAAKQQELLGLDRFIELLPNRPYCTDEKGALFIRSKPVALKRRYIQPNPPAMRHWLVFDLDHSNSWIWADVGLPEPNIVTSSPDTGYSHLMYAIESVCTSPDARPKPMEYAAAIQEAYTQALKADCCYTGLITKNPINPHWRTSVQHTAVYTLGELAGFVELTARRWTRKRALNDEQMALGRNCALFHRLRYWAYDWVNEYRDNGTTYTGWMDIVRDKAESLNTFSDPLPFSEVKATAKSVGKWVWTKYTGTGSGCKRGAMSDQLQKSQIPLSLETKQRLSARRTHEGRRTATERKIIRAIESLKADGKRVSKAAVARLAEIDRAKLYRDYSHLFLTEKV